MWLCQPIGMRSRKIQSRILQGDRMTNDLAIWRGGWPLAAVILGLIAAACLAYMAGYWDGYHAGAIIYVGGQP